MIPYFFLDIDGVMNRYPTGPQALSSSSLAHLEILLQDTNGLLVITSGRRFTAPLRAELIRGGIPPGRIAGLTPAVRTIPDGWDRRGAEIDAWLTQAFKKAARPPFLVLDDDANVAPFLDRLIKVDSEMGLDIVHVQRALARLKELHG